MDGLHSQLDDGTPRNRGEWPRSRSRPMRVWLAWLLAGSAVGAEPSPPLTSAAAIRSLSTVELRQGRPVRFRAQVGYHDPGLSLLYAVDSTGGIALDPGRLRWAARAGDVFEIEGVTAEQQGRAVVTGLKLTDRSSGSLPEPQRVSLASLAREVPDGQWVEVEGRVRAVGDLQGRSRFLLGPESDRVEGIVFSLPGVYLDRWVGARVRLRGICHRTWGPPTAVRLLVPGGDAVTLVEAVAGDPFRIPLLPVDSLTGAPPTNRLETPVRVHGWVTEVAGSQEFWLRLGASRLRVRLLEPAPVRLGASVEAVGYWSVDALPPTLEDARIRRLGHSTTTENGFREPNQVRPNEEETLPVLLHADQVRALPQTEAARGYPVRLRGVVTYHDPEAERLFIHNGQAGLAVDLAGTDVDVAPGQWVQVEGSTGADGSGAVVRYPRFEVLGEAPLPEPHLATPLQLTSEDLYGQWVRLDGVVRAMAERGGRLELELASTSGDLCVRVPGHEHKALPWHLIDAQVRLCGVFGTSHNPGRKRREFTLFMPRFENLEVQVPAVGDPFTLPVRSIPSLLRFDPQADSHHRVRVQGVVTLRQPGGILWIQDERAGLMVFAQRAGTVQPGDGVDVAGFPAAGGIAPILQNAEVRSRGPAAVPKPVRLTLAEILNGAAGGESYNARLVQIEARLMESAPTSGGRYYHLQQEDGRFVSARLQLPPRGSTLPVPEIGSLLRLTGVCVIETRETGGPYTVRLELRSAPDLEVIESPGWWTPQRIETVFILAFLGTVLGLTWVLTLQRKVRQQTRLIRERLESEAAIERQFRLFLENVPGVVFIKDADGRYLYANEAWEQQFPTRPADWRGRTDFDFWPEELARHLSESDRKALHADHTIVRVQSGKGPEGDLRYWMAYKFGMAGAGGGRVLGGILLDITERQKAEEALRQSQDLLAKAFDASPAPMAISARASGRLLKVNRSLLSLLGLSEGQVRDRTWSELGAWQDPDLLPRLVDQVSTSQGVRDAECRLRDQSGFIRTVLTSVEAIELGEEPCLLWILHDETSRRLLEAQLRQAQKMESVGRLAAGVAHDFNNMLTIIQGYVGLLQTMLEEDTTVAEPLQQISCAADRAANLTRQLLTFSRRQIMQPHLIHLNDVIRNLTKMLQRMLGEDIALECTYTEPLPTLHADPGMLEQVLMNLAVNARDAMPKGGQLLIQTELAAVGSAHVDAHPQGRCGDFVRLTVLDTGCGMDSQTLARIFEPFFTTKEVGKGTGLGLATVYGIVQQHHGWVEVSSEPGRGTVFRLYFPPNAPSTTEVLRQTANPGLPSTAGHGTVLLVEDEPALRGLASRILEKSGYRVIQARSGPDALEAWQTAGSSIDLLLTDMVMPEGMSGRDLADQLLAQKPRLKVIYTSGYNPEIVAQGCRLEGANFLQKPYSASTLTQAISRCFSSLDRA